MSSDITDGFDTKPPAYRVSCPVLAYLEHNKHTNWPMLVVWSYRLCFGMALFTLDDLEKFLKEVVIMSEWISTSVSTCTADEIRYLGFILGNEWY